jgi:hypothetical protein
LVSGIGEGVESIVFIGLEVNVRPCCGVQYRALRCTCSRICGVFMVEYDDHDEVVVLFVSLVAFCAQWIASEVDLWLEGWVRPMPSHFA